MNHHTQRVRTATLTSLVTALALSVSPGAVAAEPPAARLGTINAADTSAAISARAFPDGAKVVYLARSDVLVDALSAGGLNDGPVMYVDAKGVRASVLAEIARLNPTTVIALGGEQAVPAKVLSVAAKGRKSGRIGGASRYDTAVGISRRAFPKGASAAYLANSDTGMADAVAGGSLSNGPVLPLPKSGNAPKVILDELARLKVARVTALGGPAVITNPVLAHAAKAAKAKSGRLAGKDRLDTSIKIAAAAYPKGASRAYLAAWADLPAALAAGALTDGPVLLVDPAEPQRLKTTLAGLSSTQVVAVSSTRMLPEAAVKALTPKGSGNRPAPVNPAPAPSPVTPAPAPVNPAPTNPAPNPVDPVPGPIDPAPQPINPAPVNPAPGSVKPSPQPVNPAPTPKPEPPRHPVVDGVTMQFDVYALPASALVSYDGSTMTLTGGSYKPGDVINIAPGGSVAPAGLLVKVTGGNGSTLTVTRANLTDAIADTGGPRTISATYLGGGNIETAHLDTNGLNRLGIGLVATTNSNHAMTFTIDHGTLTEANLNPTTRIAYNYTLTTEVDVTPGNNSGSATYDLITTAPRIYALRLGSLSLGMTETVTGNGTYTLTANTPERINTPVTIAATLRPDTPSTFTIAPTGGRLSGGATLNLTATYDLYTGQHLTTEPLSLRTPIN